MRLKNRTFFYSLIIFLVPFSLWGEYRVYQYYVRPNLGNYYQETKAYLVESTLNPSSYLSYHGGGSAIKIDLLRTWICPGYTGENEPLCESPYNSGELKEKE